MHCLAMMSIRGGRRQRPAMGAASELILPRFSRTQPDA